MIDKKSRIASLVSSILLYSIAILLLYPVYWSFIGSLMTDSDVMSIPPKLIPGKLYFGNYIELFKKAPTLNWFFNSVFVSSITSFLVVLFGSMAGYGFSKKKFPGVNFIFYLMILGMMIPKQVMLIPLFKLINQMNLFDTLTALILPQLGIPFGVFLMKQFIVSIPDEILEAAKVDGFGELNTFFKIVLPIAKPGMGALAIFTFISSWNDYAWQLVAISSTKLKTLPLGVATFQEEYSMRYALLMAGGVLASLPMLIVFMTFQRYFTKGIVMGAVKG
ncbi:MAG: carbohydrate ABC transporter permease [Clostridiaceae bacterium]|nr:carbohydrate ABC transporter permease [Clostridiaceae bacterium]